MNQNTLAKICNLLFKDADIAKAINKNLRVVLIQERQKVNNRLFYSFLFLVNMAFFATMFFKAYLFYGAFNFALWGFKDYLLANKVMLLLWPVINLLPLPGSAGFRSTFYNDFYQVLEFCKDHLPKADIHLLSLDPMGSIAVIQSSIRVAIAQSIWLMEPPKSLASLIMSKSLS